MWRDKSVLIVEDDGAVREMLARALGTELGAYAVVAPDGPEALKWIKRLTPTIVILDLNLPTIDGFEVARQVKANPATRNAWIIAITALSPVEQVKVRAIEAGCDDFLPKPFHVDELVDLVHHRLVQSEA